MLITNNIILEKDYIYYILKILSGDLLRLRNAAAAGEILETIVSPANAADLKSTNVVSMSSCYLASVACC